MCGSTRFVILPFVVLYRIRFFNFSCIFRNCRAIANRHIGTCKSCVAGEMSVGPKILIRYIGACVGAVPYFFVCSHCAQNYFPPSTVFRRLDLCCHQAYCQPSAECIGRSRGGILRYRRSTSVRSATGGEPVWVQGLLVSGTPVSVQRRYPRCRIGRPGAAADRG